MSAYLSSDVSKVTTNTLMKMKSQGERIAMLTAYDYSIATLLDMAKIDVVLVGDSAANVMAGYKTTLPITLNEMIYHASSVVRAVKRALVVVDMPFGTYQELRRPHHEGVGRRCHQVGGRRRSHRIHRPHP